MSKIKILLWAIGAVAIVLTGIVYYLVESKLADEDLGHRGTLGILSDVRAALELYRSKCGEYPSSLDNLGGHEGACSEFVGTKDIRLIDRWGNRLLYSNSGGTYKLISMGNSWLEATESSEPKTVKKPQ